MGSECAEGISNWGLQSVGVLQRFDFASAYTSLDGWNRDSHQMTKNNFGVFGITLPSQNGQPAIPHDSKVKVCLAFMYTGLYARLKISRFLL